MESIPLSIQWDGHYFFSEEEVTNADKLHMALFRGTHLSREHLTLLCDLALAFDKNLEDVAFAFFHAAMGGYFHLKEYGLEALSHIRDVKVRFHERTFYLSPEPSLFRDQLFSIIKNSSYSGILNHLLSSRRFRLKRTIYRLLGISYQKRSRRF